MSKIRGQAPTMLCDGCSPSPDAPLERIRAGRGLSVCSGWPYTPTVATALSALKDHGATSLCATFGVPLARAVFAIAASAEHPVAVVPVPSTARALRRRGFRVVERCLAAAGVPSVAALAVRGAVADQRGLDRAQRARNLDGAFRVRAGQLARGARIVIADDVITTGATLVAAQRALTAAGMTVLGAATMVWTPARSAGHAAPRW